MIHELIVFAVCLGIGAGGRLLYRLVTCVEKRTNLRPVTYILDFLLAGAVVTAFALFVFLCNGGVFMPYMIAAVAVGFSLTAVFL